MELGVGKLIVNLVRGFLGLMEKKCGLYLVKLYIWLRNWGQISILRYGVEKWGWEVKDEGVTKIMFSRKCQSKFKLGGAFYILSFTCINYL